ncbi:MAG: acylphosphatase, partial [Bacteroidales bacterium]|nr:acylphosphatase [Bacteroidales bacterium]
MITGLVQGVGFRPFICRLAAKKGLCGEVVNRNDGVSVIIRGDQKSAERLSKDILMDAPPGSRIKSIKITSRAIRRYDRFSVETSKNIDNKVTEISPDIAVCDECLHDLESDPERMAYPLINCTNCGPRFSIIEDLPYDRPNTSMK